MYQNYNQNQRENYPDDQAQQYYAAQTQQYPSQPQFQNQQQYPNYDQNQQYQNQQYSNQPMAPSQVQLPTSWDEPTNQASLFEFKRQYIPPQYNQDPQVKQLDYVKACLAHAQKTSQCSERENFIIQQINALEKDQKPIVLDQVINGECGLGALLVTFNKNKISALSEQDQKKMSQQFPESLSRYIQKSFQKCMSLPERDFIQDTLCFIVQKCKLRQILFTRDWDSVSLPALQRENPTTFEGINKVIVEGNQGVIQRVQQVVNQRQVQDQQITESQPGFNLAPQKESSAPAQNTGSWSFNYKNQQPDKAQNRPQHNLHELLREEQESGKAPTMPDSMLFTESKGKNQHLLQKLDSFNDDLQYIGQSRSPNKKQMLIPLGLSNSPVDAYNTQEVEPQDISMPVVGTNQTLEKSYFRLTSAPDPADVRPEDILRHSLKLISHKWKNRQNDYRWIDEQFRSMRQDLTVQRIQNDLTVKVYETHARIALEQADLDQFNQCQTQLHYLYKKNIKNDKQNEFLAYKILYQIFCGMEMEILRVMQQMTAEQKKADCIDHALQVRLALSKGNYVKFFKLYQIAPNMGSFLMDVFIEKYRIFCLQKLAQSYAMQNLKLTRISQILAFGDESVLQFLTNLGCVFIKNEETGKEEYLDCRNSLFKLKQAPLKVKRCIK